MAKLCKKREKETKNQKAILAAVGLLLITTVAWWLTTRNSGKVTDEAEMAQTHQTQKQPSTDIPSQTPAYDPTENGKYFVIKEWGVRFPVPEGYAGDIKYTLKMT